MKKQEWEGKIERTPEGKYPTHIVNFKGEQKTCMRIGDNFYHYDYMAEIVDDEPFCAVSEADSYRPARSLDF